MGKLSAADHPTRHASRGTNRWSGTFTTAGVGADPTASVNEGAGFTVARSGVGRYIVTLNKAVRRILFAKGEAIAVNRAVVVQARSAGTNRANATITIEVQDVAALGSGLESTGLVVMFDVVTQSVVNHRGNA